jgi:hypothetical protein
VGAELFYVNRGIDTTKLTVAFRNFVNAPEENECGIIKTRPIKIIFIV